MPAMFALIARLRMLRLWMLFFTLPYAMLWVYGSSEGYVHASGGWPTVAIHSLLMLVHFAGADMRQARQGLMPRLRIVRSFSIPDPDELEVARAQLSLLTLGLIVIQLFIAPRVALFALIALGIILVASGLGDPQRTRRWRHRFAEVILPVALLVLPMALIASPGAEAMEAARQAGDAQRLAQLEGHALRDGAVVATILGALILCAFVLMCFIRDRVQDLGAGIATAATSLGRDGASAAFFAVLFASIILANWASGYGAWGWPVPTVLAIGATVSAWLLAMRDEGGATVFFFTTHIAIAILLVAMIG